MKDWVHDAFAYGDNLASAAADSLDYLVAIHFFMVEKPENEQLGDPIHEVRIGRSVRHAKHITLQFKVWQDKVSERVFAEKGAMALAGMKGERPQPK